jgi:hypothetical protein
MKKMTNKMAKKAMGLKGFMNSMSKPKMQTGGKTSFGMLSVKAGYDNNPNPTAADRIVGAKKKGKKGMNVMKEAKKNATPSIPNSYYQMGGMGMKEENPLSGMLKESIKQKAMAKKKAMAKGKPMLKGKGKKKMQAGGRFMPGYPAPLMAGNDLQSLG